MQIQIESESTRDTMILFNEVRFYDETYSVEGFTKNCITLRALGAL
jgi:hypothetical protein